ncbi:MAG: nucleotide sugar dehydrogenase [Halobacteriales archaeon]
MDHPSLDVAVVGSGYVGTTLAACLADLGHRVAAVDIDPSIVEAINAGRAPIHEPGLEELIRRHAGSRLEATTDHAAAAAADATFIAVETPADEEGAIDPTALLAATEDVGAALADVEGYPVVVVKSTVLPDVIEDAVVPTLEAAADGVVGEDLGLAVNPEFQREGTAVADLLQPDRVVLGADDDPEAIERLRAVYAPLVDQSGAPVIETGRREAATIKYASNAFLATKLSFINDLGNLCKTYAVDTYEVAEALGLDHRIAPDYLRAGLGWGGSCLPKDTAALAHAGRTRDRPLAVVEAAIAVNDGQPAYLLDLLDRHVDVADRRVAVLGLAFKPGTDDVRESRAIPVIEGLLARGADVVAYDPTEGARRAMRERFSDLEYATSAAAALEGAVGACVATDWPEFADLDDAFASMAEPVVVDGRRIVDPPSFVTYEGLAW